MSDGIKIRELAPTRQIQDSDALVVDKINELTQENVTFQLSYSDFKDNYIGDALIDLPEQDQVLMYDGDKWINQTLTSNGVSVIENGAIVYPVTSTPLVFKVTVNFRSLQNRFINATTSEYTFHINGVDAPCLALAPGRPYRFDTSDPSCTGFALVFFTTPTNRGPQPYNYGVTTSGTPGNPNSYTEIIFDQVYEDVEATPELVSETERILFYNCRAANGQDFMGNSITNLGKIQDGSNINSMSPAEIANKFVELEENNRYLQGQLNELYDHIQKMFIIE